MLKSGRIIDEKYKKLGFYSKKTEFYLEVSKKVPIFVAYNNNERKQKLSSVNKIES